MDMGKCNCFECKLSRRAKIVRANGSHPQKNKLILELLDMWANESADNDYHKVILDGSWPQAVEILERSLTKAKARRLERGE